MLHINNTCNIRSLHMKKLKLGNNLRQRGITSWCGLVGRVTREVDVQGAHIEDILSGTRVSSFD